VLARLEHCANDAASQRERFYFPRYGNPPDFSRLIRRLAEIENGIGIRDESAWLSSDPPQPA
jgi:hypothetical protein